jgi:gliding motility-associated-like protein
LWKSGVIANEAWESYQFAFTGDQVYTDLIFEAEYAEGNVHNGNILIDNVRISTNELNIPDVLLCRPGETTVLRVDSPGAAVQWSTGSTAASVEIGEAGTYWVKAERGGCTATDTFAVAFAKPLEVRLGNDIVRCLGDTAAVVLDATTLNGKYDWSTGATTPKITVRAPGVYRVRVDNGCASDEDEIEVTYREQCCLVSAPNVFTPNQDNFNDFFQISGGTNMGRFSLQVYNRWGKLVYESKDLNQFWDGNTLNGQEAASGVYFWRIDILCIRNGKIDENSFKGTVSLLR